MPPGRAVIRARVLRSKRPRSQLEWAACDHLVEALLTHALRILCQWLPRLGCAPDEPEPRVRLMLAARLSGQGSDYTGGLAQALAHAAGPRSSVPSGVIEALLLW
jgi:alcohol dehydrogenase class IV